MTFDQAVQVAKQAMIARVAVLIFPRKWEDGEFGVQFQSPQGCVTRESYVQALDALDEFPVPR
jgi:predicted RNase H-like HicB family nuclease